MNSMSGTRPPIATPELTQYVVAGFLVMASFVIMFAALPGFANPRDLIFPVAGVMLVALPQVIISGIRMSKAARLLRDRPREELAERFKALTTAVDYVLVSGAACAAVGMIGILIWRISIGIPTPPHLQAESDRLFAWHMATMFLMFAAQTAQFTRTRRRSLIVLADLGLMPATSSGFSSVAERA